MEAIAVRRDRASGDRDRGGRGGCACAGRRLVSPSRLNLKEGEEEERRGQRRERGKEG